MQQTPSRLGDLYRDTYAVPECEIEARLADAEFLHRANWSAFAADCCCRDRNGTAGVGQAEAAALGRAQGVRRGRARRAGAPPASPAARRGGAHHPEPSVGRGAAGPVAHGHRADAAGHWRRDAPAKRFGAAAHLCSNRQRKARVAAAAGRGDRAAAAAREMGESGSSATRTGDALAPDYPREAASCSRAKMMRGTLPAAALDVRTGQQLVFINSLVLITQQPFCYIFPRVPVPSDIDTFFLMIFSSSLFSRQRRVKDLSLFNEILTEVGLS